MQKVSYYATTTTLSGITWAKAIIGIRVHGQLSGVSNSLDFTVDNVDAQGQKLLPCVDTTVGSGADPQCLCVNSQQLLTEQLHTK
jgi:hypothetical protein